MTAHRWKPGQSGNPSGRPRVPDDLKKSCRRLATLGIAELEKRMRGARGMGTEDLIRFTKLLMEYGWGKPVQPIDGDGGGGPITVVIRQFPDE